MNFSLCLAMILEKITFLDMGALMDFISEQSNKINALNKVEVNHFI